MKKTILASRLFLLATFIMPIIFYANTATAAEKSVDKVVAIVNNEIITQSELASALSETKKQFTETHTPMPSGDTLKDQVLNELINHKLQLQIAQTANITTSDAEINQVIQNIVTTNHLSFPQFKQELAKRGMTFAGYKNKIHDEVIIRKLQREALAKKVTLNDQDVESAFNTASKQLAAQKQVPHGAAEYRVLDFLAQVPENPTPAQIQAAKNQAKNLIAQITKTANLEQFFKDNHGSDLGWRKAGDLPDIFAKAVLKLRPKEVAGPIPAPNGFHVILLIDVKGAAALPQNITKDQAKDFAFQQKFNEELKKWIEELRSRAYIKIINEQD